MILISQFDDTLHIYVSRGYFRSKHCVVEQQSSRKYGEARPSMQRLTKADTV